MAEMATGTHFSRGMRCLGPRLRAGSLVIMARTNRSSARSTRSRRSRTTNGNRSNRSTLASRGSASRVLAQGVGAVPRRSYGGSVPCTDLRVWDAKLPHHLPLPRAVGPYTVIRTTRRFKSSSRVNIFGCFKHFVGSESVGAGEWSSICAVHDVDGTANIGNASNAAFISMPMTGLGDAVTLTPAALSVQIMNPESLQQTKGIIYAGCMNTQAAISGRSETWDSWADRFVQFQNPRILSAGKLALKGVQINSYPLNMSAVSEFTPLSQVGTGHATWDHTKPEPTGWAPIVVMNADLPEGPSLEFLVTIEWRVRFDLSNPASAGHTQHATASDGLWSRLMQSASSRGHGVSDISETVSNVGSLASGAASAIRRWQRSLRPAEEVFELVE